jgi:endo-1,4-beta-xylanase
MFLMKRLLVVLLLLSYAQGVDARAAREEDYGPVTPKVAAPTEVGTPVETGTPAEAGTPVETAVADADKDTALKAQQVLEIMRAAEAGGTLKGRYRSFFSVGNVVSPRDLWSGRFDLLAKHFDILTAENAMKPVYLQGKPGEFTFDAADKLVDAVLEAGLKMHGHTLVWHQQSPEWINREGISRAEAVENLINHAKTVADHFRGRVVSWDVVNEAFIDNPVNPEDWRAALRQVPWYNAVGEDYIEIVFKAAREADPDALLYYNDYNLDNPNKAMAVYSMVKEINEKNSGVLGRPLIDGIGMQGHYRVGVSIDRIANSLKRFASLGVQVSITELDVQAGANHRLSEEQAIQQGATFARLFALFREHADVLGRVTIWGLDDGTSWRAMASPTLFDRNLQEKPAFFGALDPEGFFAQHGNLVIPHEQEDTMQDDGQLDFDN